MVQQLRQGSTDQTLPHTTSCCEDETNFTLFMRLDNNWTTMLCFVCNISNWKLENMSSKDKVFIVAFALNIFDSFISLHTIIINVAIFSLGYTWQAC